MGGPAEVGRVGPSLSDSVSPSVKWDHHRASPWCVWPTASIRPCCCYYRNQTIGHFLKEVDPKSHSRPPLCCLSL